MAKRSPLLLLALALILPLLSRAQRTANFSGSWKLAQIDPPVDPRNGRPPGPGGGLGGGGALSIPSSEDRPSIKNPPRLILTPQSRLPGIPRQG